MVDLVYFLHLYLDMYKLNLFDIFKYNFNFGWPW